MGTGAGWNGQLARIEYVDARPMQERIAKLEEALRGLLDRHRDGSEEQYWAEWDTAIDALKGN